MASIDIICLSCSAADGVFRNGKNTAGHQRYRCFPAYCKLLGIH